MADIVERLRELRFVHVPAASQLMDQAADEIARLRLTAEEREAIELFAALNWTSLRWSKVEKNADTLRKLLERLS